MASNLISKTYNVSFNTLNTIRETATSCNVPYNNIFYLFLLPILMGLFLIVLIKFKEPLKTFFLSFYRKSGYIKIMFWLPNRVIKEKIIKLDNYDNFKFKKRRYNLNKQWDFLQGYDKNGFPVFFYDYQFILPLKLTKKKVTKEIKEQLGITDINEISAIEMKLESSILETVYSKRLLSDLYSISKDDTFTKNLIYISLGVIAILILYYTGLLDKILNFLGVKI